MGGVVFAGYVNTIATVFAEHGRAPFEDWSNASNTADRLLNGEPLYHPGQLSGPYYGGAFTLDGLAYPPPSAVLFVPFRGAPVGLALWLAANVAVLMTGLAAIVRNELGRWAPPAIPLALAGLLAFPPFAVGVMWGNLNVGLAGLFAWAWVDRARWTGLAMGVGVLLKIYPGLFAIWRVRADGWRRPLTGMILALATLSLITLPFVGLHSWGEFVTAMANTQPTCLVNNSSATCLFGDLGLPAPRLIASATSLALVLVAVVVRNKPWAFALTLVAVLVGVLDLHFHYWTLAYVVLVATISRVVGQRLGAGGETGDGTERR